MATTPTDTTNWTLNTDIYDITDTLLEVKKRYIEDESESTLNVGIFGYITDLEAKKIQTSTTMIGQLGNEMFPTRANLTKNVIAHAIYTNITDINAIPANLTINIGIKTEDLDAYMESGKFTIDSDCPIFISDYEFHFEYDIILQRTLNSSGEYAYSAHYDMSNPNRLSHITEPYLVQPFTIKISNHYYVVFQANIRQYTIEETTDKIISNSIIENKSYTFSFDNQIADFDVYISENGGEELRLTPYIYGTDEIETDKYCWYLFISDNTIRISFDSASYVPGFNADIRVRAYTTLGEAGNFAYKTITESGEGGLYIDMNSDKYGYDTITCYAIPVTNSVDGTNKKTKSELQRLIPKMAHSRGSITTEDDVLNYFNLIDSPTNRIVMRKKIDNQISRVWYAYFVLKDIANNMIPTNTIALKLNINDGSMILAEDGRYILPAGSVLCLDATKDYAEVIDAADVPELYSDEYFANNKYYYMTIYNILLDLDPLYAAYYMTISNSDQYYKFTWVNEDSILQFVANKLNFKRSLLTDQSQYKLSFNMAQSIASDYGMYIEDESGNVTNNMKAIIVLYKDGVPYRWQECNMTEYDKVNYVSKWALDLVTDNGFDTKNDIKINNLHVAGSATDINYGYFEPNTKAIVYILAKFADAKYGRYDLDTIAPGFDDYTVTNVYEINGGLNLYTNYTNVLNTRVIPINNETGSFMFYGIPCVGMHYMSDETAVTYFINTLSEKKRYIDDCLVLLENNMDIDFKFFNTYGPSKIYCIGDNAETEIGHVDLKFNFKVQIKSTTDIYTKDDIIVFIKNYIENIDEIGDLHIPNLITDLTNKYGDRINYIEYINFNDFGLGVQHIVEKEEIPLDAVPEFLNIRNHYDDTNRLVPCINLEVVY